MRPFYIVCFSSYCLFVNKKINFFFFNYYESAIPLYTASDKGHLDVVKSLLEDGVHVKQKNIEKLLFAQFVYYKNEKNEKNEYSTKHLGKGGKASNEQSEEIAPILLEYKSHYSPRNPLTLKDLSNHNSSSLYYISSFSLEHPN